MDKKEKKKQNIFCYNWLKHEVESSFYMQKM